jgi:hypothetical protein
MIFTSSQHRGLEQVLLDTDLMRDAGVTGHASRERSTHRY